jgi:1-acyl-sn-glycerol-3-phosphate acyltransferase
MVLRFLRIALRAPLAIALLLGGLATIALVFPRASYATRDRIIARWSRWLLRACGIRLIEQPAAGAQSLSSLHGPALLVANHISWIDIFLMLATTSAHFVAKIEIASWPVVGRLVIGAGTLFIERGKRHAVHQLNERIASMLAAGRRIAVFPEGTTSDGLRLLQFHGNLLEPALRAQAPMIPVGIRYTDLKGQYSPDIDFTGNMSFGASMKNILGAPGFIATLHTLSALAEPGTRQLAARAARAAIANQLSLPLDDTVPDTLRTALGAAREKRSGD